MRRYAVILFLLLLFTAAVFLFRQRAGCGAVATPSDSSTSLALKPTHPPAYYVQQGIKYFRTMESSVPVKVQPRYSEKVIRWEWHPWLLLTGYGRHSLIYTDILLKLYPTKYDTIDCRYFDVQPFCRCHVVFNYSGKRIPIYEEFTFNNRGEITFIEAWSDFPGLLPMNKNDYWAQGPQVNRLSTRVPGLGNATGLFDVNAPWAQRAALKDSTLADLIYRIKHPVSTYIKELRAQRKAMEHADKPPPGEVYPYYP